MATRWTIRHGLMLLWFKDLMNVTETLQFIDSTFRHSCLDEGTRQECRNVGSMNCNFLVTFIKSLNLSNIKPCTIILICDNNLIHGAQVVLKLIAVDNLYMI